jgi:hypothetical protein
LGFGNGVSININAASSNVKWFGNDFMPVHTSYASDMKKSFGGESYLTDDDFASFCNDENLPKFDFIALHGVWSWVNEHNRKILTKFFREKLNVGGVVYISYNLDVGWAGLVPFRDIMKHYYNTSSVNYEQNYSQLVGNLLGFAERTAENSKVFCDQHPNVIERIRDLKGKSAEYILHEYLNEEWFPTSFSDLSRSMESAKLTFAASAHMPNNVESINFNTDQIKMLNASKDPTMRELLKGMFINYTLRRDYWVKGYDKLCDTERLRLLDDFYFVRTGNKQSDSGKIIGALGEGKILLELYEPIISFLDDYTVKSFSLIREKLSAKYESINQLLEVILFLVSNNSISIAQDPKVAKDRAQTTERLNSYIIQEPRNRDVDYLASPVTGAGKYVNKYEQYLILGYRKGLKTVEDLLSFSKEKLEAQGDSLSLDGKVIKNENDKDKILFDRIKLFLDKVESYKGVGLI